MDIWLDDLQRISRLLTRNAVPELIFYLSRYHLPQFSESTKNSYPWWTESLLRNMLPQYNQWLINENLRSLHKHKIVNQHQDKIPTVVDRTNLDVSYQDNNIYSLRDERIVLYLHTLDTSEYILRCDASQNIDDFVSHFYDLLSQLRYAHVIDILRYLNERQTELPVKKVDIEKWAGRRLLTGIQYKATRERIQEYNLLHMKTSEQSRDYLFTPGFSRLIIDFQGVDIPDNITPYQLGVNNNTSQKTTLPVLWKLPS